MKKSKDLLDLPLISVSEGEKVGIVRGFIINPDTYSVDFLTIEQEEWQISLLAIPFKKIVAIGEYAVMIEKENSIIDLNEIPYINELINKKVHLIGSKVITRNGELSGEIIDYYFNEDNGHLESFFISSDNKELYFPIENVLSLGKEHVIINDSLKEMNEQFPQMINNVQYKTQKDKITSQQDRREALKAKLVDLIKGNSIKKDIFDKSGELLFAKGTILSDEDIKVLAKEGSKVLVEIPMDLVE